MKYLKRFLPLYMVTALLFVTVVMGTDRAITTVAQYIPVQRTRTIIIDAGHGGEDGGASSCTGVLESGINLEIALRLEDLCHLLGYQTRMIRRTDVSVYTEGKTLSAKKASDLRQRVRMVNETEGAILVSIHQNTYIDSRYAGAQVFYAKTSGSMDLAKLLQLNFCNTLKQSGSRQAKEADNIYLMRHIEKTGVLVECGFLSNPQEEKLLQDGDYQKKLCCIIVCSLSQYINT